VVSSLMRQRHACSSNNVLMPCVCVCSGASSGFGEAIAWRLAEAGCKLIITARRLDRLQQLQQQLVDKYQVHSCSCSSSSSINTGPPAFQDLHGAAALVLLCLRCQACWYTCLAKQQNHQVVDNILASNQ
jgi:NAD(P)-dependent dehydrogenase (short-subunit alcohol dehydrogenase family)